MAKQFLFAFAIVAVALPSVTFAAEILVGDADGWTIDYDYEGWAKGKEFRVGDKLVFKYPQGSHNVHQVDEDGYKECKIPSSGELTSGEDKITLDSPGPKYFVCGVGVHCLKGGQKLAVVVKPGGPQGPTNKPKAAPSPAPIVGSPNVANVPPSHAPTSNDLPNNGPAPEDSSQADYLLDAESPSPPEAASVVSPPPKSNGVQRMEYAIPMVVATAMLALANVL